MKVTDMFIKSLMRTIIRASLIGSGLAVAGIALVPAVASAGIPTANEVDAIKYRLTHASTMDDLTSALQDAKSVGAPWQWLYESVVYYTIRTGDYSLADGIIARIDEFVNGFTVNKSLLCGSEKYAAILMQVFRACVDLHNGDTEDAQKDLLLAWALDPETTKALLSLAATIQEYTPRLDQLGELI